MYVSVACCVVGVGGVGVGGGVGGGDGSRVMLVT